MALTAGVAAWTQGAVKTTASAPSMGQVNRYNATASSLTVTLPALSGLNIGARTLVQKDTLDVSGNTVTFNRAGSDQFDDGATGFTLTHSGESRTLQVVSISGVKRWKITETMVSGDTADVAILDAAENVFTGKMEINSSGVTNPYDSALFIAPAYASPTTDTQGSHIQHRISGDLHGCVHDATISELIINGTTNDLSCNGLEATVSVLSGSNTIDQVIAGTFNFHTDNPATGSVDRLTMVRAQSVLPGWIVPGFTANEIRGLEVDQQTQGTKNWSVWAPDGDSVFGPIVAKDTTSPSVIAKSLVGQDTGVPTLVVRDSSDTSEFSVMPGGRGGLGAEFTGTSFWVNNNLSDGTRVGLTVKGHASQTANLLELKRSNGDMVFGVNNNGTVTVGGVNIIVASGSPEGVYGAVKGSMFLRTDGGAATTLYVKETGTGTTGWAAK